jgi:GT2 family glycosyltransferase
VIVNYKTPKLVTNCLEKLLPELMGIESRVVVVDNNSADNSCEIIRDWIKEYDIDGKVKLVISDVNGGFSFGNNLGIQTFRSKYYLLLNSDTLVLDGSIAIMLDTAESKERAGIVSPKLEWSDGRGQQSCFRFHTPISEFLGAAQTGIIDAIFSRFVVAPAMQTQFTYPEWTMFACVLIRDEVFQEVGLMDEKYFMYYEDVEFCHRARKAGWEIVHEPNSRVVHLKGGSSTVAEDITQKRRLPLYYYEARTLFFYQTYGWLGLTVTNLLWETGRLLSKARQLLGRPDKAAIENQWLDIWVNWLDPLKAYTHPDSKSHKG